MKLGVTSPQKTMSYMVDGIKYVCQHYKKRSPGSQAERDAQEYLKGELEQWSDDVIMEDFELHPKAFMGWIPAAAIAGIISVALFWARLWVDSVALTAVATALTGIAFLCFVFEFLLYRKFCDRLFPKAVSRNVYATRKPTGEVKKRIIFGGHTDAAWEWTYSLHGQALTIAPIMFGSIGGLVFVTITNLVLLIQTLISGPVAIEGIWTIIGIIDIIFVPLFAGIFFFINWKVVVDGANDNLTADFLAMSVLKDMAENDFRYENTEVCCLLSGSEEAGLRGALAFAEKHKDELNEIETVFISMDTMHEVEQLMVYTEGQTGTVHDSKAVGQLVIDAGKNCGIDLPIAGLYPGAVDAEAFTRNGLLACGFCGVNHNPKTYYHTRKDSWDNINEKCLDISFKVCKEAVNLYDKHGIAHYEKKVKKSSK